MQGNEAILNVAIQAQGAFILISALAMAVGVATARKQSVLARKGYLLGVALACLLTIPSFIVLKPLILPDLDFSDPNPDDAALMQAARLMAFAAIPTAILVGRYTAYRNRDAGNEDYVAYLASIPIVGSVWMLRLLLKP